MRGRKMKYKVSELAKRDMVKIWQYTSSNWSLGQANHYLSGLLSAFGLIADDPAHVGQSYEHVRPGYRKYHYGRHMVFYKEVSDGAVLIVRVLHDKMDVDRHL